MNIHITYHRMVEPCRNENLNPEFNYAPYRNIDCEGYDVRDGIMYVWGANAEGEGKEFWLPLYHVKSWYVR